MGGCVDVHVLVDGDFCTVGGAELGWVADHESLSGCTSGAAVLSEGVGTLVVGYLPDSNTLVGPATLFIVGVIRPGAVVGNSRFGGLLVRSNDIHPHRPVGAEVLLGDADAVTDDVNVSLAKVGGHEVGSCCVDGGVPPQLDKALRTGLSVGVDWTGARIFRIKRDVRLVHLVFPAELMIVSRTTISVIDGFAGPFPARLLAAETLLE